MLARAMKRDEAAFIELYRRHEPSIFRFALHMSGRVEIAEEVTQEVFLTLIAKPKAFREAVGALQGFLIGIARNKLRRYASVYRRSEASVAAPIPSDFELRLTDPFEVAELRAAILSLPARYREVVVLCELNEVSYDAAARTLGCAVGTVRSRLHRARQILTAKLRKAGEPRRYKRCAV